MSHNLFDVWLSYRSRSGTIEKLKLDGLFGLWQLRNSGIL